MEEMKYRQVGEMMVPELYLPEQHQGPREDRSLRGVDTVGELGKYGRARLIFLQERKLLLHQHLVTTGQLKAHLMAIQQSATKRMELLTAQMAEAQGVDETLKARDQMEWLGRMNGIRASAEEVVMRELVNN